VTIRIEMDLDIGAYNAILPDYTPNVAPSASKPGVRIIIPSRLACMPVRARDEGR